MAAGFVSLPDELISQILQNASTPTFIQLTRTCKRCFNIAAQNRKVLLHHLHQVPGDKSILDHDSFDSRQLFLLLRQRATNALTGINYHANLHEYAARGVSIDPVASSIGGLDADYVRMALCFKGSADIRQYTSHCAIKEKIKQISGSSVKVLKLVQWGRFVSALCFSPPCTNYDDLSDEPMTGSSCSETEALIKKPFAMTANAHLQYQLNKGRNSKLFKILKVDHRYQVVHFDVYTMEDSLTFEINPLPNVVPRDFAVYDSSQCAILWDNESAGQRPTEDAFVVTYNIDKRMTETVYEQKTVWPKTGKPPRPDADSDDDDVPDNLPERIAFFKEGRRIKMYQSGGIVPYQIFSTTTTQYDQFASTNVIDFDGFSVHVDTPFFGTHTTQIDEMNHLSYCFVQHLCLGVATLNLHNAGDEEEVKILCILRSQTRNYPEACQHQVCLDRMMHVSANNSTIVARLWGWEESNSNFSGKDTVAISPGGTRIAISMWNKVLVYPLNPKVLCDEVVVDSSDDESLKSKKKKKKARKPWEKPCTDYYQRKKDKNLLGWKVAELRPIVLDLDGAVAHKMSWSPAKGPVTDTEEAIVTPVPDVDSGEEDAVNEEAESTNTNDFTATLPVITTNTSAVIDTDNQEIAATPVVGVDPVPQVAAQGTTNAAEPVPATNAVESPAAQEQKPDETEQPLPVQSEPAIPAIGSVSAANTELKSEQSVSMEVQSLAQPTKKTEATPVSPVVAGNMHSSPPTTTATLTSTFPLSPYSPFGTHGTSQASKTSTRKKEKAPDTSATEATSPSALEKKMNAFFTLPILESSPGHEPPPSWSPPANKSSHKSNQTVAEAMSLNQAVPNITLPEAMSTTSPAVASTAAQLTSSVTVPIANDPVTAVSQIDAVQQKSTETERPATPDHSKEPSTAAAPHSTNQVNQELQEQNEDRCVKRKKRITEDELIILTDRGIQVWNLGARAKGKRKKSVLRLEESLRGKLPRLKGKRKETIVQANDTD